jgi:predicted PurR-regulated permease PerM
MAAGLEPKITAGIVAVVAVSAAAYLAASVFAPLVLALFIISIVWPLQARLQSYMPKLVALAITILITIAWALPSGHWPYGDSAGWVAPSSLMLGVIRRFTTIW